MELSHYATLQGTPKKGALFWSQFQWNYRIHCWGLPDVHRVCPVINLTFIQLRLEGGVKSFVEFFLLGHPKHHTEGRRKGRVRARTFVPRAKVATNTGINTKKPSTAPSYVGLHYMSRTPRKPFHAWLIYSNMLTDYLSLIMIVTNRSTIRDVMIACFVSFCTLKILKETWTQGMFQLESTCSNEVKIISTLYELGNILKESSFSTVIVLLHHSKIKLCLTYSTI